MGFRRAHALFALMLSLSGCGWMETYLPLGARPYLTSAPPPQPARPPAHAPSTATKADLPPGTIMAAKGDTVHGLARRYNVSVRELIEMNGLKAPYGLLIGQHIRIPGQRGREHVVQKGETAALVARAENISLRALIDLNGLAPPYVIQTGQRLRLPEKAGEEALRGLDSHVASTALPPPPSPQTGQPALPATEHSEPPAAEPTPAAMPGPSREAVVIPRPPQRSGRGFQWPLKGKVLAGYGSTGKGLHNDGINIAAPRGASVKAAENGVVVYAGNELKGFGNLLLVKHEGGWVTAYAHNEQLLVGRGDKVKRGQQIARVGSTGNVNVPQLHFEIRRGSKAIDPTPELAGHS
jgi:murein DD-endopeptidase MepM/ murein hydrolase activator NlpD